MWDNLGNTGNGMVHVGNTGMGMIRMGNNGMVRVGIEFIDLNQ